MEQVGESVVLRKPHGARMVLRRLLWVGEKGVCGGDYCVPGGFLASGSLACHSFGNISERLLSSSLQQYIAPVRGGVVIKTQ